jgi:hypothetical protein
MFAKRHHLTTAAMLLSFSAKAFGCSCAPPPPPCQAVGQSGLVFLGTVTEVSARPGSFKTARMNVDRAFKGSLNKTVELFDDGMCDGPTLEVGKQYLMYTSRVPGSGAVPARGCTRSRAIEYADEDLEFLRQYSAGKVTTHIDGTVRYRPDEPDDSKLGEAGRTPMKDVRVTLSGPGKTYRAVTNSVGGYSFSDIPPGQYEIDAEMPGFRLNWAPDVILAANGCVSADMLMKADRRVMGTVRDVAGAPVSGTLVEMISTNDRLKRWEQPVLLGESDENGRYVIDGIPLGEYYLGVNIVSTPTMDHPYPSTYYPATPDKRLAMRVSVLGPSIQEFDLRLPETLPIITIRGLIHTADGMPPRPDDHAQVRIKEPGLYGQIEKGAIRIDAEGKFTIELCEGVTYSAFAFSGPVKPQIYSAPIEFRPTKENDQLILTLDKTQDEFLKLRPK